MSWHYEESPADLKAAVQRRIEQRRQGGETIEPFVAPKARNSPTPFGDGIQNPMDDGIQNPMDNIVKIVIFSI